MYRSNHGAPHCSAGTMDLHIVQLEPWSSTLYSTNNGAPHCTARIMELHIVQYKPWSSTLYSLNHGAPHCTVQPTLTSPVLCTVLYCLRWFRSVSSSCCSSLMFINFVTKLQPNVACPMAVLSLHFLAMCENKILSLLSPCSVTVTFMELYLHASQPLVLYCTPLCTVFSIHDTRVLVGSVCNFGIRIAYVWLVTPCCLVDGYEPAKMEASFSAKSVPTYGTKTWRLLVLDVCVI